MMKRFNACAAVGLLLSFPLGLTLSTAAGAGTIEESFEAELARLAPVEHATAIVVMKDQVDLEALKASLAARHASRGEAHREVVDALRAKAEETQTSLLAALDAGRAQGTAAGYTPYWIANLIVVRADRAAFQAIANRAEVERVERSITAVLFAAEVVESGGTPALGIGITPGLRAIHADQVWSELGIRGEGTLVANLDTGVDGNHPALRTRWRGFGGAHPASECWRDVIGTTSFPFDANGHGTHVMGSITGLVLGDSIGVAPAAQWIAANPINQGVGNAFNNDILDCFQWLADPDGDAGTIDDVPDVVQNSWGVNEALGYSDCDARWSLAIDGCEASGVVVLFSAGGDGPAPGTIRSPADRASTFYSSFSVGVVDCTHDITFPYAIASFSSRGPSGCAVPPERKIKPELSAPGVDIYSSLPGNSYGIYSGTAMGGPHVAGVVALMREANPDLPVDDVKRILMETARDEGTPGEDNTYGWGFLDAYEAVLRAIPNPTAAPEIAGAALGIANRPNPARPETRIELHLATAGPTRLTIFDPTGRRVRSLVDGMRSAGRHSLLWDGRDDAGRPVPTGVYLERLENGGARGERKLLLLR